MPILRAEQLEKTFPSAVGAGVTAVHGVDLVVEPGEFVAITGASGSGKSTLLHMLGGITRPTSGRVFLEDTELALEENVGLPLVLDGISASRCADAAREALASVGMEHRAGHRPDALSGGEQQRGAIARALVTHPAILLADEPTGALDSVNSANVLELLRQLVTGRRQTVILVTHEATVAAAAGRIVRMKDGRIAEIVTGDATLSSAGIHRP